MSKVGDIAQSILNVTTDPCLHTVATQLNELHEIESAGDTGSSGPTQATLGIGLCRVVGPLKVVIWARKNPWIFGAISLGVVGGIFGAGYRFANRRKTSGS